VRFGCCGCGLYQSGSNEPARYSATRVAHLEDGFRFAWSAAIDGHS
jgi:hypothetical protein